MNIVILLIALTLPAAYGYCPTKDITFLGHCSYKIKCSRALNNFRLEPYCLGSSNYNTTIHITVDEAEETLDTHANPEVLQAVTSLTVFGDWSETNMSFVQNMFQLRHLKVIHSRIHRITGSPFRYLNIIQSISLSHNSLTDLEGVFQFESSPTRLKTLILSYNKIDNLRRDTFEDLSRLTELDLSYNAISDLSDEPFANLTDLVTLKLNNNRISQIGSAFNYTRHLKHLYLANNEIDNLNEYSIATINDLETLDISRNKIAQFEPAVLSRHWDHLDDHSICRILLSDNNIVSVPNTTLEYPTKLSRPVRNILKNRVDVHVDLSKNSISNIEYNAFQAISHLTALDVSANKLLTFIVNAEHLQYITYLNLSCNHLTRIHYESFALMRSLQSLDLSHNNMDEFPDEPLGESTQLRRLNLTNNAIENIDRLRLTFHTQGGVLDLSNNGLTTLKVPKDEAYGLTDLILSCNNITELYQVQLNSQYHLLHLNLSQNYIQELDENSVQLPESLIFLDLSANIIQVIEPSSFQKLPFLNNLRLSRNRIREIKYGTFNGLTSLKFLDLSFNNIDHLDSKYLLDLQSLEILSLRSNHLNYLDHNTWLTHKHDLMVYLDDNDYSCDWLAKALQDYQNGYSKMRPMALRKPTTRNSILDIPCSQLDQKIVDPSSKYVMSDDRLLVMTQKILEVLKEQSGYMKRILK
ncbi:leucine-rich repeat-containing protein 15-like [Aricia agestis]|uniref:leucine-rich repeat-containing protein 15-like n=1 Tax=Aricia agestis TaxID=91739 RepID=UPI001C207A67|nr:leucine-rich repeat-containing protein 15-like [Aricia agestis]